MSRAPVFQKVNRGDPTPKYLQAREILIDAIRAGRLAPGMKLPSTKEISTMFDISLITAHKALEGLVESGWLRREVGRGTYVREDIDAAAGQQRQLFVGLLIDHRVNIDDYYHSTIINALRREAGDGAARVEFFFRDHFDLREKSKKDVGAICIHPPLESQAEVERLAQRRPTVVLGGAYPDSRITSVDCDNERGARHAIRHLLELGHKEFLLVSGPMNLTNARDRAQGALAELAAHGIALDDDDHIISQDSVVLDERSRQRLERRVGKREHPTAIFAGGFYLAMAAMQVVRQAGLVIPVDVSVVGFDDPPSAPLLEPPLTTVRQPLPEMAGEALRLVCALLQNGASGVKSCKLPTEVVIRGSTGPAGS